MKVIIVPTDFSENAFNALQCAIQYFTEEETQFIILHTYDFPMQDKQQDYEDKLDHLLERVEYLTYNHHHRFETRAIAGNFITQLNDQVDILNADLIVMGTQGKTADRKRSLGSNTLQVIKNVSCPVLAIPLELEYKSPDSILFPSGLQVPFKDRELDLISNLALQHRSSLHLLHIAQFDKLSQRQIEVKEFWESRFRESVTKYTRHDLGDGTTVINNFINKNDIDLLVLVNSKHSFLESFLKTTTIDALGLHLKIPFLILQNLAR
ncbi:universal stress protein [Nonlabens arenilitoris]|uniref:Universal stress protein n=1 Tax=Nonlabens arenilitoris TaxID=1217969 RepID=A0A2S7U6I1_9FLAO|nr:universal stress protein [Nonlabens arenilitoris]PQJ30616.1 universal stress protein [Nonlabens arenilitoris]